MTNKPEFLVIESPLKAWPGGIGLPLPDEFNGVHWRVWKDGINTAGREHYARVHAYCYSLLELIAAGGGSWDLEIPLAEVQSWEHDPEAERIKVTSWLGRSFMVYMDGILDPKE